MSAFTGRRLAAPPAQALARDTLGLTSGLAEDAAEILERDYDIDAGEVLSMNIDTVETQTSSSEVKASDADTILGTNGQQATWSSYMWATSDRSEKITATKDELAPSRFYELKEQSGIQKKGDDGIIETDTETRVVLTHWEGSNAHFPVLVNTSEYQKSSEITEATYRTTFGCDHRMAATLNGECGEAWWFFKLAEDFSEGYALCFDNHGSAGCGVFGREWGEVFLVYYNASGVSSPAVTNANVQVLGKCGIGRWENDPRYDVEVKEKDGKFTVTITPDELNLSTYQDGASNVVFTSYTHGYRVEHSASTATAPTGVNDKAIQWQGATKDPIVFQDIAITNTLKEKNTTQAFQSYKFLGTYFANNSVDVVKTVVKSFGDIVYEPEWTDGALHMLINMDTKTDSTMLGNDGGRPACERPEPCHGQRPMNVLYICAEDAAGLLVSDDGAGAGPRPRPTPSGSPRGWRRTRRRSWRGTTT